MFLTCTFAYIVYQLVLSCYAHVLHLFFIIVSQLQLQLPLMFSTGVGALSVLQCFDAVSWVTGKACKKLSGGVLLWLSVWSEVQTCTWPS